MINHFYYWLTGKGWAEIFISSDKQNIRFELSYLSDPLADLFKGLCRLITNKSKNERISFWDEPGEHSLVISKIGKDKIILEIFRDNEKEGINDTVDSHDKRELIYSDMDNLSNLSLVICTGIDDMLGRHSLEEYKEKWVSFDFPLEDYNKLKQLLN